MASESTRWTTRMEIGEQQTIFVRGGHTVIIEAGADGVDLSLDGVSFAAALTEIAALREQNARLQSNLDGALEEWNDLAKREDSGVDYANELNRELSALRAERERDRARIAELEKALDEWDTIGRMERALDSSYPEGNPAASSPPLSPHQPTPEPT